MDLYKRLSHAWQRLTKRTPKTEVRADTLPAPIPMPAAYAVQTPLGIIARDYNLKPEQLCLAAGVRPGQMLITYVQQDTGGIAPNMGMVGSLRWHEADARAQTENFLHNQMGVKKVSPIPMMNFNTMVEAVEPYPAREKTAHLRGPKPQA